MRRKGAKRPKILTTHKEVMGYLTKLCPRYRIRLPMRDKRGPFLYIVGKDIPGNTIHIRESTFNSLRRADKIILKKRINTSKLCVNEWVRNPRPKPVRRKKKVEEPKKTKKRKFKLLEGRKKRK